MRQAITMGKYVKSKFFLSRETMKNLEMAFGKNLTFDNVNHIWKQLRDILSSNVLEYRQIYSLQVGFAEDTIYFFTAVRQRNIIRIRMNMISIMKSQPILD